MNLRSRLQERRVKRQLQIRRRAAIMSDTHGWRQVLLLLRDQLPILDRALLLGLFGLAISYFAPWSAMQFVFSGNRLTFFPQFDQIRRLDDALARLCLAHTAILLLATITANSRNSLRPLLLQLPVSDAAIRRRESPMCIWPLLFGYTTFVLGLFEWHYGPRTWTSVVSVPFLALAQSVSTLSFAGIVKLGCRTGGTPSLFAILRYSGGMFLAGACFFPTQRLAAYWPGNWLLTILPTGWSLWIWRDGWIEGQLMPWLIFLAILTIWATERWLVNNLAIPLERKRPWYSKLQELLNQPKPIDLRGQRMFTFQEWMEYKLNSVGGDASTRRGRWLAWPLKRRDLHVVDFMQFPGLGWAPTWFLGVAWCLAIPWGRLITWFSDHTFYLAAFDTIGVLIAMFVVSCFASHAGGMAYSHRLAGAFPIGYDETLRASFLLAVAFAKRFLPGQLLLAAVLMVFDHLAPLAAISVALGPLLLWMGCAPLVYQAFVYPPASLLSRVLGLLECMVVAVAASRLMFVSDLLAMIGLIGAICLLWIMQLLSRWFYERGIG